MQKLSEAVLRDLFNERTYERGLDYYENGHVLKPARYDNTIYAKVIGNSPEPYEVIAKINGKDTFTRCTCPVGGMCKHGVALLLTWINEPKRFSDRGKIIRALEKKSKEELLEIIKKAISENPYLIDELKIRAEGIKSKEGVNADLLIRKINRIASNDAHDYPDSIVRKLDDIRDIADTLAKDERYADASRVYLKLVGAGLTVYGDFIEDDETSDKAVDLIEHSIKNFNKSAQYTGETVKERLWNEILKTISLDDWGMDIEELFYGVITKENIGRFETWLMDNKNTSVEKGVHDYSKKWAKDLLNDLYEHLKNDH